MQVIIDGRHTHENVMADKVVDLICTGFHEHGSVGVTQDDGSSMRLAIPNTPTGLRYDLSFYTNEPRERYIPLHHPADLDQAALPLLKFALGRGDWKESLVWKRVRPTSWGSLILVRAPGEKANSIVDPEDHPVHLHLGTLTFEEIQLLVELATAPPAKNAPLQPVREAKPSRFERALVYELPPTWIAALRSLVEPPTRAPLEGVVSAVLLQPNRREAVIEAWRGSDCFPEDACYAGVAASMVGEIVDFVVSALPGEEVLAFQFVQPNWEVPVNQTPTETKIQLDSGSLAWQEHGCWEGTIRVPYFVGFTLRWYITNSHYFDSSPTVQEDVDLVIVDELGEGPSPAQLAALEFLLTAGEQIFNRMLLAIGQTLLDEPEWWNIKSDTPEGAAERARWREQLPAPEAFRDKLILSMVKLQRRELDGFSNIVFNFRCTWDEEHGCAVAMHKDRVVEISEYGHLHGFDGWSDRTAGKPPYQNRTPNPEYDRRPTLPPRL